MVQVTRGLLTLTLLLAGAACGRTARLPSNDAVAMGRLRTLPNLITFEEMQRRGQHSTLYVLIQDLRPRWLRPQGPDALIGSQGQVQVHMDGNRLGSVAVLRRLSAYGVTSIEWFGPIDAAARFGPNNSHGAIVISTAVIH